MRALVLALLTVAGCSADGVVAVALTPDTPEYRDRVGNAARDAFGLEVVFADEPEPGTIAMYLAPVVADEATELGRTSGRRCSRRIDAHPAEVVIAHELGHALGLTHRIWRAGLMRKGNVTSWDVSDAEVDRVWLAAERLQRCG